MKSVENEAPEWLSAYYGATVQAFLSEDPVYITGKLVKSHGHDVELEQLRAWEEEIRIFAPALRDIAGTIYLEFEVPRLASRIDAVLIVGPAILAIEFKVGEKLYRRAHYNQVWDYALDLKNFLIMRQSFRCWWLPRLPIAMPIGKTQIPIRYAHPDDAVPPAWLWQWLTRLRWPRDCRWTPLSGGSRRTILRRPSLKLPVHYTSDIPSRRFHGTTLVPQT